MRSRKYRVELTETERKEFKDIISKGKSSAIKIKHAHILLKLDESKDRKAFDINERTVCQIAKRFVEKGMEVHWNVMMYGSLVRQRHVEVTDTRKRTDFAHCIKLLVDEYYPDYEKIVLVMDNLNTHSIASLYTAFAPAEARRLAEKLKIHYTPKHASWLDMAEIEIGIMSR